MDFFGHGEGIAWVWLESKAGRAWRGMGWDGLDLEGLQHCQYIALAHDLHIFYFR